ncbi:G3E family GTPase [Paraburkholderia sp. BL23I1N1]|uniref:CobW family GTP-binding protein n=1 Tax=Paraburkholderia sp. BL23I1N1 TaxID=1938802 RepID=UPI000E75DF69|nr:GTP-binding protein [Paraburkholderia sp. BL23I1N1]RKE35072.1 G3E family GTPase [Paraburkholderia sp. BL23I1N1]
MTATNSTHLIPTTILTGFLGSGKTTLLNRILSEYHGGRVAVIENEFGETGIDNELLVQDGDEQIVEMNNGCICCTVRGDLVRILSTLAERRAKGELNFERVIIETTGLADPAPVAQTFFVDDTVQASYVLDAIVTVVDAKHAEAQLSEHHEAQEQVGFADRILMSKVDLVSREEASQLAARLRQMNPRAPIRPVHFGETDLRELLDIRSFDLNAIIDIEPDFLADLAHEHDDDVTSFVYCTKVPLDRDKVEEFFSEMVATYGPAMLRYKGVLDIHGVDRRTVFQGVHMIFGANIDKPWGGVDERETKIVFIGKQLPADLFRSGLDNCMIREDLRQ